MMRMNWKLERGFSLLELLVVLVVLGIIVAAIALPAIGGARKKRIRADAMSAVPVVRGFEESWFDRAGAFVYSADTTGDKVTWNYVTTDSCEQPIRTSTFQQRLHAQVFSPPGWCTWEYWVIDDLCEPQCAMAGADDARQGTGRLYCVIATSRETWSGGNQPLPTRGERFCMDKVGNQFSNVTGLAGWP